MYAHQDLFTSCHNVVLNLYNNRLIDMPFLCVLCVPLGTLAKVCIHVCPSLLLLSVKVLRALAMVALEALDVNGQAVNPEEVHLMYLCALTKCFLKPVLLRTCCVKWVG